MSKLDKMKKNSNDQPKINSFLIKKGVYEPKEDLKNNKLMSLQKQQQLHKPTTSRHSPQHSINSSLSYNQKSSSHLPNLIALEQKQLKSDKPSVSSSSNINVLFYLNSVQSQPHGEFIDKMHQKWATDYQKLQRDHSFIQWIFPNSFQSRFNNHAKPLTKQQAYQFRKNPLIYNRYIKSYEMMLGFYGLKLKSRATGELVRSRKPDYKQRFYKTLVTSFHNHMRITRILTSLRQVGFAVYALQLCRILKYQIQNQNGAMTSLKKYGIYKQWEAIQKSIDREHQPVSLYFKTVIHQKIRDYQTKSIQKINEQKVKIVQFKEVPSRSQQVQKPQKVQIQNGQKSTPK